MFPEARYLQNPKWGFPHQGDGRRTSPSILLVVHSTYILPTDTSLPTALEEVMAASAATDREVSFTFCNDRDGTCVQSLDPVRQAPWTNGILRNPNTRIATVEAIEHSGLNPNEHCFMTVENVANESLGRPITEAQIRTLAAQAAWGSIQSGLPVTRETVLGHRDFDSTDKHDCPTAGDLEALLAKVISQAHSLLDARVAGLPLTVTDA